MKLQKKIFWTFWVAACAGLIFSVGSMATSEKKNSEPAKNAPAASGDKEVIIDSYGNTLILAKEPVELMFSHKSHVIAAGLTCDDCHPDVFEKKRGSAKENGDYTMDALNEGRYCGTCHNDDIAFGTKAKDTCKTCHGSDMQPPKTIIFDTPVKAVIFDHALHTEDMGLDCDSCHQDLFKMKVGTAEEDPHAFVMDALYKGKYCGACHDGDQAFASDTRCTTCHIGVKGFDRLFGSKTPDKKHGGGEH